MRQPRQMSKPDSLHDLLRKLAQKWREEVEFDHGDMAEDERLLTAATCAETLVTETRDVINLSHIECARVERMILSIGQIHQLTEPSNVTLANAHRDFFVDLLAEMLEGRAERERTAHHLKAVGQS